jgi:hypothetical protein
MGEVTIPKMLARTIFRVIVLVALTLQVFASVAEAANCMIGHSDPAEGCPSFSCDETAVSSASCSPGGDAESSYPAHDPGKRHCSVCPICLAPFVEASPVSVSPDDLVRRFAPAEFATLYEAPSFALLRPPIA